MEFLGIPLKYFFYTTVHFKKKILLYLCQSSNFSWNCLNVTESGNIGNVLKAATNIIMQTYAALKYSINNYPHYNHQQHFDHYFMQLEEINFVCIMYILNKIPFVLSRP